MKPLPTRVRLAPHTWTVREVPQLGDHGECDSETMEIRLRAGLDLSRQMEALLHETFHALIAGARYEMSEKVEEAVVSLLGVGMTRWWMDNPGVVDWMEQTAEHLREEGWK